MIKSYIRKIVLEVLNETETETETGTGNETGPQYHKLTRLCNEPSKKSSIYDCIAKHNVSSYCFSVCYKSADGLSEYYDKLQCDDASEFYNELKSYKPLHPLFSGCSIVIRFTHPSMGEQREMDILVNEYNHQTYKSSELTKLIVPLVKFFEDKPELLI